MARPAQMPSRGQSSTTLSRDKDEAGEETRAFYPRIRNIDSAPRRPRRHNIEVN